MHKTMATSRHSITKFHNTENEDSDSFSRGEKTQEGRKILGQVYLPGFLLGKWSLEWHSGVWNGRVRVLVDL